MFAHISQHISIKAVWTETTEITSRCLWLNADRHRSKHFFKWCCWRRRQDSRGLLSGKQSSNECAEAPEFVASTRTTPCQIDKVLLTSVRCTSESGAGLLCICPKAFVWPSRKPWALFLERQAGGTSVSDSSRRALCSAWSTRWCKWINEILCRGRTFQQLRSDL